MRLINRVALISGGEGSIGLATARVFAAEGARVALIGVAEDRLRAAADEFGENACTLAADVTDSAQVAAAVAETVRRFGRLDVVFSNAGVFGVAAPVTDYPVDEFDRVLAVHVKGSFLLCKHTVPAMSGGGSVIINSSVVGLTSAPGISGYATAKHALVGLMRTLAKEVAPRGIRVNSVHPGPVDNEFQREVEVAVTGAPVEEAAKAFEQLVPLGRHARPDEIARVVLFLASDDSSFMTGSTVVVDGGMSV